MDENHMKPLDVIALEIVLGGDHGKGAFRLALRAIVTVTSGTMYHCDYGGVAYVTGKKHARCPRSSNNGLAHNGSRGLQL